MRVRDHFNAKHIHAMIADAPKKVALIFGATGGIGSALCAQMTSDAWTLALASRSNDRLAELPVTVREHFIPTDATHSEQVDRCFAEVLQRHGRLDAVAHCVGSVLLKPAHTTSDSDWNEVLITNLTSAFYVLRAAARLMRTHGGSIVLVSSVAARRGLANHEAIAAAKAGIIGLTLSAAATYARNNIRVNCVAPGLVRTPLTETLTSNEATLRYSTSLHPLRRIGEPAEVASAIGWLLDPKQSWITGQVLGVDGGMATVQPSTLS